MLGSLDLIAVTDSGEMVPQMVQRDEMRNKLHTFTRSDVQGKKFCSLYIYIYILHRKKKLTISID